MDNGELLPFGRFFAGCFPNNDPHLAVIVAYAVPTRTVLNSLILVAYLSVSISPIIPPSKRESSRFPLLPKKPSSDGLYSRSDDGPLDVFARGPDGTPYGRYPLVKSEHIVISELLTASVVVLLCFEKREFQRVPPSAVPVEG